MCSSTSMVQVLVITAANDSAAAVVVTLVHNIRCLDVVIYIVSEDEARWGSSSSSLLQVVESKIASTTWIRDL